MKRRTINLSAFRGRLFGAAATLVVAAVGAVALAAGQPSEDLPLCGVAGTWIDPETGTVQSQDAVIAGLADRSMVLLGESHTNAEHHRWQLSALAALHGQNPRLAVGFEAFPRRVQPVLDDWSQGRLGVEEFLEKVEWNAVWGVDANLYLPLLHFARMHRLPVVALNVERDLISQIGAEGLDAVPEDAREGVDTPIAATGAYLRSLSEAYLAHQAGPASAHGGGDDETSDAGSSDVGDVLDDPAFKRFVQAQQFWDRAMAEAMRDARASDDVTQVVGIIGRGHLEYGHGVPAQLEDMGIADHAVLLPSQTTDDCATTAPGLARAVFLIDPVAEGAAPPRLKLGVYVETADGGARVESVLEDSVAAATGLEDGDVVVEAAGMPVDGAADLIAVIGRQSPGTWLPLTVERDGERMELVAKFGQLPTSP